MGCVLWGFFKKIDRVITAPHCTWKEWPKCYRCHWWFYRWNHNWTQKFSNIHSCCIELFPQDPHWWHHWFRHWRQGNHALSEPMMIIDQIFFMWWHLKAHIAETMYFNGHSVGMGFIWGRSCTQLSIIFLYFCKHIYSWRQSGVWCSCCIMWGLSLCHVVHNIWAAWRRYMRTLGVSGSTREEVEVVVMAVYVTFTGRDWYLMNILFEKKKK